MIKRYKDVDEFVAENMRMYFDFLSNIDMFPYVCHYSSQILGAYLHVWLGEEDYCYEGFYDTEERWHMWQELKDGRILDFTHCQFDGEYDEGSCLLIKKEGKNLFDTIIVEREVPILITPEDWQYDEYHPDERSGFNIVCPHQQMLDMATAFPSFEAYLGKVKQGLEYIGVFKKTA